MPANALFDHRIVEQLHASGRSLVWRARAADGSALIVKRPSQPFPAFRQVAQFKREYAIARRCRHPNVVRPLALRLQDGCWTMLLEDSGGTALDKLLHARAAPDGAPATPAPDLDAFFDIALQACAALEAVHRQGVIHKDVNPSNLVWNRERRLLQLIDFGIACELPQESQGIVHPGALEGTLRYMAPEQTGRMNRHIDYRADLYALGATFYELLTGQAPFGARDAMELVHCHIARSPDWSHPALAALPPALPAILRRLLEKNAERRYQSLRRLRDDLAACRAAPPAAHARAWPGGDGPFPERLLAPQTLHGRERETGALLAAFERSAAGGRELLLVSGAPGIGKSALVNEVHRPIVARRGRFLAGKCEQFQRDVPYAALVQAFQGLVRELLGEPAAVLGRWSARLHGALGANLGVMLDLMPALGPIVGPAAAPPALAPEQARLRLQRAFPRFVDVFAAPEHPLVLFLDDLQWADAPTLQLIALLMTGSGAGGLLVIGACRDKEVDAQHPLAAMRDKLRAGAARLSMLTLGPLEEADVTQLVAATVRAVAADCVPLARLCLRKTGGNPFFLNQFLAAIHEAGHLRWQAGRDCWDWDLAAIERADYTDNVVDLLLDKIRRLPAAAQRLLQLGASIGNRFALGTLALAVESGARDTQRALWPALEAGLIQPLDERYKYVDDDDDDDAAADGVAYRFLHDRVQQAAYLAVDAAARAANHLRIGRLLLHARAAAPDREHGREPDEAHGAPRDAGLFAIVEQLNAGRALLDDPAERLQLARLNLRAGIRARRCAAFQATLEHMRGGLDLLPAAAWQDHAGLWRDLQLGAAEAAYLCGRFDAAEAIYPLVRAHSPAPLLQVRCIAVQAHQYQLQGRLQDAIDVLRDGLARLDMAIPAEAAQMKARFDALLADIGRLHGARDPEDWLDAPEMSAPEALAAMQMMQGLWMASYYAGQQDLSAFMVLSMTQLSMRCGNSDFSAVAYVGYAYLQVLHGGDPARGQRFGAMALALARRRANLQTRILAALMFAALTNHWTRHLRSSDALYEEASGWALEIADFVQVGVVAAVRATERIILGDCLPDLLHDIERDLALMRANGQQAMADCCVAAAVQPIRCLMGLAPHADRYDDAAFSEAGFLERYGASRLYRAYYLQGKIRNAYLFDGADAEDLAGQLEVVTQMMRGQAKVPESTFYAALIWLRALRRDPARNDAAAVLERIAALQASLAAWAEQGPDNLGARHALVQAEMARGRQDLAAATHGYRQAADAAGRAGYVNVQALANELCGECWLDQEQPRVAALFLQDAIAAYRQWGAEGKAAQLRARHAAVLSKAAARTLQPDTMEPDGTQPHPDSRTYDDAALDLASLLKAARILSNETGLRKVLQRLIAIVRENAGAQAARLLLLNDGVWRLEADADGDAVSVLQSRAVDLDAGADAQLPLALLRYAVRTGLEVIEDGAADSARFGADPYIARQRPRAVMCLPIRHGGRVDGVLYCENRLAEGSFTAQRVAFLRMLGAQAMVSIGMARLHDSLEQRVAERTAQLEQANRKLALLSATDGLTDLANRRRFDEVLRSECARSERLGQPLALVMLDVDHFKKFNDRYGHQAGDACLVRVARALAAGMRRAGDLAARYGGEEFAIVLPNTGADEARRIADTLRAAVKALAIAHAGAAGGRVTISVGIAVRTPADGTGPDALLGLADAALYRAKAAGRNRVAIAAG